MLAEETENNNEHINKLYSKLDAHKWRKKKKQSRVSGKESAGGKWQRGARWWVVPMSI